MWEGGGRGFLAVYNPTIYDCSTRHCSTSIRPSASPSWRYSTTPRPGTSTSTTAWHRKSRRRRGWRRRRRRGRMRRGWMLEREVGEMLVALYSPHAVGHLGTVSRRRLQRDVSVVYLGWPIAPSNMSPNAGRGEKLRGLRQWVHLYTGAQIKFGDLYSKFNIW